MEAAKTARIRRVLDEADFVVIGASNGLDMRMATLPSAMGHPASWPDFRRWMRACAGSGPSGSF